MNVAYFNSTPNKFLTQSESRKYLVTRDGISVAPSLLVTISSFKGRKKHCILHSLIRKRNLKERRATIILLVFNKREDPFNSTWFQLHTLTSPFYLPLKHSFQQGDLELRCYKSRTLTFQESSFLRDSPARRLI